MPYGDLEKKGRRKGERRAEEGLRKGGGRAEEGKRKGGRRQWGRRRRIGNHREDALSRCQIGSQDSSMVRFLPSAPLVKGSSPTSAKLSFRVSRVASSL